MKIIFNSTMKDVYLIEVYTANSDINTQKEIAERVGIHEKTLSRLLNGKNTLSIKTAKNILQLTEKFKFDDLFTYESQG